MRRGPDRRRPVPQSRGEVRRRGEAADDRGPGRRHCRMLVRATTAHLRHRSVAGGLRHPGRRRGDRAVVVEGGEDERLEDDTLGEARLDGERRGAREVDLALGVAPDRSREAVVRQPVDRRGIDDALTAEERKLLLVEAEVLEHLEDASRTCDDAVTASGGKARPKTSKRLGR